MIRITADLFAFGGPDPETIAVLEIGNRNATGEICDYDYRFGASLLAGDPITFQPWFVFHGHDRRDGIWALVAQILARRAAGAEQPSDYGV